MRATQMKYHSQAGKDFMGDVVYMMHLARTEAHFDLLASVALATLRCVRHTGATARLADRLSSMLDETEVAAWFDQEYCQAPWNGWWIGDY